MKLLKVRLENIFAYKDATFDFSATTPDKNIVLIWGRNGMGKTSFLNAMKLLFTGAEQTEFRMVGVPPAPLSGPQYVLGDGSQWTGLINREARRRASALGEPVTAQIVASWLDNVGETVTATRWWTVEAEEYTTGIIVERGSDRKTAQPAQAILEDTIPSRLVRFFFFDGEDIKSLAESSGSYQADFNRLLQITFLEDLARELVALSGDRKRSGLESSLRKALDEAQASLAKAKTLQLEAREALEEIESLLSIDSVELRRVQIRRANLSSGASEAQRKLLEEQLRSENNKLSKLIDQIVRELPKDVPILANLGLVQKALQEIVARMSHAGSTEAKFANNVSSRLKGWIAEGCPALSDSEGARLSDFLSERINGLLRVENGSGLFAAVSPAVLERLVGRFETWVIAGGGLRSTRGRALIEAYRLGNSVQEIKRNLFNLEVGANGNAEEFRQVSNKVVELEEGIAKQNQLKGQWTVRAAEAVADEQRWAAEVKRLEESQDQVSQAAKDSRFVLKAVKALNEISERIKIVTRAELETMLNDRFKRIIQHPLIDRIGIDEGYVLTFYEKSGKPIGRTSLSSGMKQLAATALLWAMKDSADSDVPVIIDTPLGRIDRENQEHLLRAYYPVLSKQVIILPTNAEIDDRKLKLLSQKVATHFRILNTSGDAATVEEGSLV
ncbi:AAA family ATPase [Devosia aurantiaca]|uniref:AAA family ATPase n=1 Tax=Devosia aurantiaca TaxID=2714858 RepID=A0A6M1S9P4_9HYPH|nr:AAA family ATPase [Devosia aurantiaca]NGP16527.1 AAA family ATPase [Devosia aurantiaca]